MDSMTYITIAIVILCSFGFVMTTYGKQLAALPDQIDNPVLAAGVGIAGLVTTAAVLGAALIVTMNMLFTVLGRLDIW